MKINFIETAFRQLLQIEEALEKDDKQAFVDALNQYSIDNVIVYTEEETIKNAYTKLLLVAIEKWVLNSVLLNNETKTCE